MESIRLIRRNVMPLLPLKADQAAESSAKPRTSLRSSDVCIEQAGTRITLTIEPAALAAAFGVDDPDVASHLLRQLVNAMHPDPNQPVNAAIINSIIAMVRDIGPRNVTEAMTATMLVTAQHAAFDVARRAMHPDQSPIGRQVYLGLALKAMRTHAQLLESFNHGREKGRTQRVIVERVTVRNGNGQAAVEASVHGIDHQNCPVNPPQEEREA
jgi:hypothetical protein